MHNDYYVLCILSTEEYDTYRYYCTVKGQIKNLQLYFRVFTVSFSICSSYPVPHYFYSW
jgi:hypothetical protein